MPLRTLFCDGSRIASMQAACVTDLGLLLACLRAGWLTCLLAGWLLACLPHRYSFASDVWSLGITLYCLALGKKTPFEKLGNNHLSLREHLLTHSVIPDLRQHKVQSETVRALVCIFVVARLWFVVCLRVQPHVARSLTDAVLLTMRLNGNTSPTPIHGAGSCATSWRSVCKKTPSAAQQWPSCSRTRSWTETLSISARFVPITRPSRARSFTDERLVAELVFVS